MGSNEKAVLTTILYSNIFHFPQTLREIHRYLIHTRVLTFGDVKKSIQNLDRLIVNKDGFFTIRQDLKDIANRKKNVHFAKKKVNIAKRVSRYISVIPTILFVGISGGLAVGHADKDDDIDFFIICKKNTLWISRVLLLCILQIFGVRRKRSENISPDNICVNMLIDESALAFPKSHRDIYTAREIVQMQPVLNRSRTYETFLSSNSWVYDILPNAQAKKPFFNYASPGNLFAIKAISSFESLAKMIQIQYMKKYKTSEIITENILAFHPFDYRIKVLQALNKKQKQFNIL